MLKPRYPVKSNQPLELNRGNPFDWEYSLDNNKPLDFGVSGWLTFANSYGQTLATWEADATDGVLPFYADATATNPPDSIPASTGWVLTIDFSDGNPPRVMEQGTVIRTEAPQPNAPAVAANVLAGVNYNYPFGVPGPLVDPAWRILAGLPQIYDNSGASHPNAVAAGVNSSGLYPDVCLFYYAPLNTDTTRFTYTIVPSGAGDVSVILCSNYDASNFACIHHHAGGGDYVAIAKGTGPVSITDQTSHVSHAMAYENFTAEYNPSSNTFSVYQGTNTTPLVSWVDGGNTIHHGNGDRYVGLIFSSTAAAPGPEVANWFGSDNIGV